ncbi:DUF3126 family protein [Humitalea sp. 24SJ18S-53]|uniref:DUF3126 family protein n=1 Tax=Humitalea sp. 24SJ18S-53 TaxID=3422307 RepID=UPI003D67519B
MTPSDIDRVQTYLRRLLGSDRIQIVAPRRAGQTVEIMVNDEVIGTLHRDDEEGEVSYSAMLSILEEDLPPAPKSLAAPAAPARQQKPVLVETRSLPAKKPR